MHTIAYYSVSEQTWNGSAYEDYLCHRTFRTLMHSAQIVSSTFVCALLAHANAGLRCICAALVHRRRDSDLKVCLLHRVVVRLERAGKVGTTGLVQCVCRKVDRVCLCQLNECGTSLPGPSMSPRRFPYHEYFYAPEYSMLQNLDASYKTLLYLLYLHLIVRPLTI
jgi:hypothetical protein